MAKMVTLIAFNYDFRGRGVRSIAFDSFRGVHPYWQWPQRALLSTNSERVTPASGPSGNDYLTMIKPNKIVYHEFCESLWSVAKRLQAEI